MRVIDRSPELTAAMKAPPYTSERPLQYERCLSDLGLLYLSDQELLERFDGVTLDIGSGLEDFARGLQQRAVLLGHEITVLSLNPQLTGNKRPGDKSLTPKELKDKIRNRQFGREYVRNHRLALASMVQAIPLRDESVDNVISTMAFPTVFQEMGLASDDYEKGFQEVCRILKVGGTGIFAPVYNDASTSCRSMPKSQIDGLLDKFPGISRQWAKFEYPFWHGGTISGLRETLTLKKETSGLGA